MVLPIIMKNYARWAVQRLEQEPSHEKKANAIKIGRELIKFIKDFIDATTNILQNP